VRQNAGVRKQQALDRKQAEEGYCYFRFLRIVYCFLTSAFCVFTFALIMMLAFNLNGLRDKDESISDSH
jgi:hypothetical protein